MIELTADEARVLGVLVEKAQTTPGQYPMTLNGLVVGCNQKSNRFPVMNLDEDEALEALDGLRSKEIVRQVELSGSRVPKFRHVARETLNVDTSQLVVLAELLLRGPQTIGEIRGRASRMHALESIEVVQNLLKSLMEREQPLVRRLAPLPGTRAERYQQTLAPEQQALHTASPEAQSAVPSDQESESVSARLEDLERQVHELNNAVARILAALESQEVG